MDEFQLSDTSTSLENVTQVLNYFDIPAHAYWVWKQIQSDLNIGPYVGFKVKDEIVSYEPDGTQLNDADRGRIGLSSMIILILELFMELALIINFMNAFQ